jgi:hypothetical protein
MNNIIKLAVLFACSVAAISLSGCLKDKDFENGVIQSVHSSGSQNLVEIGLTSTSTDNFYFLSVNSSSSDTTINLIPVNLASAAPATQDIHVTLKLDSNVLKTYNAANGTTYALPPTSAYTIINNVVTIPAGSNTGYLQVKFKSSDFIAGGLAFAFSIANTDGGATVSGNANTGIVAIGVKNKYDGNYTVTGTLVDAASPSITGPYPWNVSLVTSGASQVQVMDNDYTGDIYHKILSGGSSSYYGSFGVVINFNADNTVSSIVNKYGQPAGNGRSAELDPSGVNKWDPVTKTLKIKYWMNQPSVISGHRTSFNETFTYVGPR